MNDIISKISFRVVCLISFSSAILMGMYLIEQLDTSRYKLSKKELIEAERFSRNSVYMIRSSVREYINDAMVMDAWNNIHDHPDETLYANHLPHSNVVGRLSNPHLREKLGISPYQLSSTSFSMLDYYILSVNNNGDAAILVDGDQANSPEAFYYLDMSGAWLKIDDLYTLFKVVLSEHK